MFNQGKTGNTFLFFMLTGLLSLFLLSGCGHRGDLYLPDANDTTESTKPKKKAS